MGDVEPGQSEAAQEQPEVVPEPEALAAEEAPPEEVEAKPEGDAPEEGEATEAKSDEAAKAEEKRGRKGGWQRKAERLEREREILLEQLGRNPPPGQAPASPGKEKTAEEKATEYIDSIVERRLAAREAEKAQRATAAAFQERTQAMRAQHPDFDDALLEVGHIAVPQELQRAILTSEQGPAIMYQLAKNPAELSRICDLPPLEAARAVGRLEAQASSTPAPKSAPKSATRPPAPPTNVGGSASSSTRNLDDLPLADYKRAMRSGRAK